MLATISIVAITVTNVNSWAYDKQGDNASHWADYYAECGYSRQSPIDIPLHHHCEEELELQWTSELSHYAIRNNGKSLLAMPFRINHEGGSDLSGLEVLHHTNDTNIRLENSFYHTYESGVNKEYCFDSLHFHWGHTNSAGSEHTVNGESYPLEVHLVHYSCDYKVASSAIHDYATGQASIKYDDENVLAVIGVIFEIGKPNLVLKQMLDDIIIDGIAEKRSAEDMLLELYYTDFDVKGLLPESREIISYLGSLTTPPCFETVRWHVLKEKMTVSEEQMEAFRSLLKSEDINDTQAPNFRPPMPLNGRTVYQCKEDIEGDALFTDDHEKDEYLAVHEEEEATDTDDDDEISLSESELIWRMIGIAFICLFMVTLAVCMIALICLCRHWHQIFHGKKNHNEDSMEMADRKKRKTSRSGHMRSPSLSAQDGNTQNNQNVHNGQMLGGLHHI